MRPLPVAQLLPPQPVPPRRRRRRVAKSDLLQTLSIAMVVTLTVMAVVNVAALVLARAG